MIRRPTVWFIASLLLCAPVLATPPAAAEAEVRQREQEWNTAIQKHDAAAAAGFLTESYVLAFGIEGQKVLTVPRARWLETLDKVYRVHSWHIDDLHITFIGETAVVLMLLTQSATVAGADRSGQFVITDIWVKEGGQWKVTQRISSRPSLPLPPKLDPRQPK